MKLADFPRMLAVLSTAWDTAGGMSLRRLLWSLRGSRVGADDQVPMVRLWHALSDLDDALRVEFGCLVSLSADAQAALTMELFVASGEWERVDAHPLPVLT